MEKLQSVEGPGEITGHFLLDMLGGELQKRTNSAAEWTNNQLKKQHLFRNPEFQFVEQFK